MLRTVVHDHRLAEESTGDGPEKKEEHKLLVSLVQSNAAMGDHAAAMRHFDRACAVLPDEPTAICDW